MESEFRDEVAALDATLVASPFVRALVERVLADGAAEPYAVIRAVEALAVEADAETSALVAERDRLRDAVAERRGTGR